MTTTPASAVPVRPATVDGGRGERTSAFVVAVALACAGACIPTLTLPPRASIACASATDCPAATICAALPDGAGRCVASDSPCVDGDARAVDDGTPCGDDGACVAGACGPRGCGDGLVDRAAGEACDPLHDPGCRADCTPALCGDSRVDFGEACDDRSLSCVACTFTCSAETFADEGVPWADCDLDAANGCECAAPAVPGTDLPTFFGAKFLTPTRVFVQMADDDDLIRNFVFDARSPEDATELPGWYDVTTDADDDARAYAIVRASGVARIAEVDLDQGVVASLRDEALPAPGYLRVVGARFYVGSSGGLHAGDVATGVVDRTFPGCDFEQDLVVCGGEVVCSSADPTALLAVDVDAETARELDRSPEPGRPLSAACVDGRIVWRDVERIFLDGPDGPTLLRSLPASFGGMRFASIVATHDPGVLLVGLDIGGVTGPYAYAYDVASDTLSALLPGQPRAGGAEHVVAYGALESLAVLVGRFR